MKRRNFIKSAAGLLIPAPMVVKAENIMRVKPFYDDRYEANEEMRETIFMFGECTTEAYVSEGSKLWRAIDV